MVKANTQHELELLREQLAKQRQQIEAFKATLDTLLQIQPETVSSEKNEGSPKSSPTKVGRRRLLRGLGVGIIGGASLVLTAKFGTAQANSSGDFPNVGTFVTSPNFNNWSQFAGDGGEPLSYIRPRNSTFGLISLANQNQVLGTLPQLARIGIVGTADTIGVYGKSESNIGVYGDGITNGVYGNGSSVGVYGKGGNYGVKAEGFHGVYGNGTFVGVRGDSSQFGLWGSSPNNLGVYGNGPTGMYADGATTGIYGNGGTTGIYGAGATTGLYGNGGNYGVYGYSSTYGMYGYGFQAGVYGDGPNYGVFAQGGNSGLYGSSQNIGVTGNGNQQGLMGISPKYGVVGEGTDRNGIGVSGSGSLMGVAGNGGVYGVLGVGSSYGVYGLCTPGGEAGHFDGKVTITGTLNKAGGSFKIDHPLDPANQYLYHSFVESPDMLNIYNGLVTLDTKGEAVIQMPRWFEALNQDFRYQLTCLGRHAPVYVAQEVQNNQFKVAGGLPGQKISWQVTGVRHDEWAKAHRIPVEETKNAEEKGKFLHPELFGQPQNKAVSPAPPQAPVRSQAQAQAAFAKPPLPTPPAKPQIPATEPDPKTGK